MNSYTNARGVTYYHHEKITKVGSTLHYFSRQMEGSVNIPDGYQIIEVKRSGLPLLKKAK